MSLAFLVTQFLNGLANASSLFIIASGLTIVFGVTRIVNFAHGSLYMLGAYLAVTIAPRLYGTSGSFPMFVVAVLASALITGLVGAAIEIVLLRRIYHAPELLQLLATFALVLIGEDLVLKIWGPLDILGPRAPGLAGAIEILGTRVPTYDLFQIAAGPVVLGLLWLLLQRTRFGVLIRAATQDREMVAALGVNQAVLFTATLCLGAGLAGLGGALQTPRLPATPQMDIAVLTDAFVVTVIGGMGSIPGAFLAALLIGELQAFGILVLPKITLVLVFALMALVLVVRPWGLLGRPEAGAGRATLPAGFALLRPVSPRGRKLVAGVAAGMALLPLIADAYTLKVAIEVMIFALAAFSLALLISNAGIVSFGHAAYFGIGAYASGLAVKKLGLAMEPALVLAPIAGGLGAALYGFFIVRLSGIYLAMLTLAFAQITFAVAFQWVELTGGDNGIVGVWPARWAASRVAYYYLVLVLAGAALVALDRVIHAPFGYTLRAARDSGVRAGAIGINVMAVQWAGFVVAGAAAGLAGGLYAFSKGSIDPTILAIPTSVDFLAMLLLGGVQHIAGAVVGAAALHTIKDFVMPWTDYWRTLLGLAIIAIVLVFPQGLAGGVAGLARRGRTEGAA